MGSPLSEWSFVNKTSEPAHRGFLYTHTFQRGSVLQKRWPPKLLTLHTIILLHIGITVTAILLLTGLLVLSRCLKLN